MKSEVCVVGGEDVYFYFKCMNLFNATAGL